MSPISRSFRRLARLTAAAAVAAGVVGAPSAHAAQTAQINYKCKFPLIGTQPLTLNLSFDFPERWTVGDPTDGFAVSATALYGGTTAQGLGLIEGLHTIGGVTEAQKPGKGTAARMRVALSDGSALQVRVPINIEPYTIAPPVPDPLVLNGAATTPSITVDVPGEATFSITELILNLYGHYADGTPVEGLTTPATDIDRAPYTDIDGDVGTYNVPCKLDPAGQSLQVAALSFRLKREIVGLTAPQLPDAGTYQAGDQTCSAIRLRWKPATIQDGSVKEYAITYDGAPAGGVRVASPATDHQITGLTAGKEYTFSVVAYDQEGTDSEPLTQKRSTAPGCDGPGLEPTTPAGPGEYAYSLRGRAAIKSLVRGTVPLSGGLDLEVAPGTGDVTADLALGEAAARLRAVGFLPVTGRLSFMADGPVTGRLAGLALRVSADMHVKLRDVKLFGVVRLGGAASCQTKTPSEVVLQSTEPTFDPAKGGPVSTTFKLSNFSGCSLLNSVISPLTANSSSAPGNSMTLSLTPAG